MGARYAFDSRAAGYGRGEGVGTLILETHKAALRDGDPIRAIIREMGLNQDGKTPTITSPSQDAQEQLMRHCYDTAGIDPATVTYVEVHGTGTQAGDPVEAAAVDWIFGRNRESDSPVFIGSVKTNIGHLEPASGFSSVIKVALALSGVLYPQASTMNPQIRSLGLQNLISRSVPENASRRWSVDASQVPTQLLAWPRGSSKHASVNNSCYGGTNAHVNGKLSFSGISKWDYSAGELS